MKKILIALLVFGMIGSADTAFAAKKKNGSWLGRMFKSSKKKTIKAPVVKRRHKGKGDRSRTLLSRMETQNIGHKKNEWEKDRDKAEESHVSKQRPEYLITKESAEKIGYRYKRKEKTRPRKEGKRLMKKGYTKKGAPKYIIVYKAPHWPYMAPSYEQKDIFTTNLSYRTSSKAFSSSGHSEDATHLAFGESTIYIKDIFLASKLASVGTVDEGSYDYLDTLAEQKIDFDGEVQEIEFDLNFARHFIDNSLSFGLHVPLCYKKHDYALQYNLTNETNAALNSDTLYQSDYGGDFETYFRGILSAKGMEFNKNDSEAGHGDIAIFLNYEVPTKSCERLLAGCNFLFPTARDRSVYKLWDPECGKGGFIEASAFASAIFAKHRLFNPHFFVKGAYNIARKVSRRIPQLKTFDGVGSLTLGQTLALGGKVHGNGNSFSAYDTEIARFASQSERVKIRKGPSVDFRVGNVFEKVILDKGFLDIFFDFYAKGRDYIGARPDGDTYKTSALTLNTFATAGKIGLNYNYQFDEHFRLHTVGLYTFMGRNVPETYEATIALSVEF
jgi:hypothetical protein